MSSDLKAVKKITTKYNIKFVQKPYYGICLIGSEAAKRKILSDQFFTNLSASEMHYDYLSSFFNDHHSLEYGIIEIIKKHNVTMSDYGLCDLLINISITITRLTHGFSITEEQYLSHIEGRSQFIAA